MPETADKPLRSLLSDHLRRIPGRITRSKLLAAAAAVIVAFIGASTGVWFLSSSHDYYIAYVGRYRDNAHDFEELNEYAVRHFVERSSFAGQKLGVKSFAVNDSNPSTNVYRSLAEDSKCVAVIDNTWKSDIEGARAVISTSSLPVISINADRAHSDYNDRVAFIGHDDYVAIHICRFLAARHSEDQILFVGEETYWSTEKFQDLLTSDLLNTPQERMLTVPDATFSSYLWDIRYNELHSLAKAKNGKRLVIVLNVHYAWGEEIIRKIEESAKDSASPFAGCMIIGGPFICSSTSRKNFEGHGGVELLLLASPKDALTPSVLRATEVLKGELSNSILDSGDSGHFVTRCSQAVEMLRYMIPRTLSSDHDTEQFATRARAAILTEFLRLSGKITSTGIRSSSEDDIPDSAEAKRQKAFSLSDAILLFDEHLLIQRPPRLEVYDADGPSSYRAQLTLDGSIVPNIYIGIEITGIRQVNLQEGTFLAEFSLSLRYDKEFRDEVEGGPDDTSQGSKWTPDEYLRFVNAIGQTNVTRIDSDQISNASYYYRCVGTFSALFDASEYPLDTQSLPLRISLEPRTDVTISFDDDSFSGTGISDEARKIPDWSVPADLRVGIEDSILFTNFEEKPINAAQILASIELKRRLIAPLLAVVLPLVAMGLCACLILCLEDLTVAHIGEISIGLFIGFVGYVISYRSIVPDSQGINRADWLLFSTAGAILAQMILIIAGGVFLKEDRMKQIKKVGYARHVGWVTSACYTACLIAIVVFAE